MVSAYLGRVFYTDAGVKKAGCRNERRVSGGSSRQPRVVLGATKPIAVHHFVGEEKTEKMY